MVLLNLKFRLAPVIKWLWYTKIVFEHDQPTPTGSLPVLTLHQVSKRYGDLDALSDLSFTIPENRYVSLVGASGSGKTTLLRLIVGFEEPDSGHIMFSGKRLDGQPTHHRDIGFVFQNFALFPHMSVADNVAFGLRHRARNPVTDPAEVRVRTHDMLELVGLQGLEDRAIGAISGGQKQRVALARTLVTEPRVVLLDEPLGALDANLRDRMCDELRAIRERLGISFLHVTGSEVEAMKMGDEVAVLSQGRIVQSATPGELFTRPANADAARHLNGYNTFAGRVSGEVLDTPEGALRLPAMADLANGAAAELSIRFDLIRVLPLLSAPRENDVVLPAHFITSEFNGPTMLSFFKAQDGELVQVLDHLSDPRLPELQEGQDYLLCFSPEDAILHSERAA